MQRQRAAEGPGISTGLVILDQKWTRRNVVRGGEAQTRNSSRKQGPHHIDLGVVLWPKAGDPSAWGKGVAASFVCLPEIIQATAAAAAPGS